MPTVTVSCNFWWWHSLPKYIYWVGQFCFFVILNLVNPAWFDDHSVSPRVYAHEIITLKAICNCGLIGLMTMAKILLLLLITSPFLSGRSDLLTSPLKMNRGVDSKALAMRVRLRCNPRLRRCIRGVWGWILGPPTTLKCRLLALELFLRDQHRWTQLLNYITFVIFVLVSLKSYFLLHSYLQVKLSVLIHCTTSMDLNFSTSWSGIYFWNQFLW
jgi:hypothetical protein